MMATATTTAATMIERSSAMPTAVITESSENTMSSTMICAITAANDGYDLRRSMALLAFEAVVNLERRLGQQEQAAAEQNQVAAREPLSNSVKSGAVSRMIQASDISSRMRMIIAAASPRRRALRLLAVGQLAGENRDEDDVVDAEDDFEKRERRERDEAVGGQKSVKHRCLECLMWLSGMNRPRMCRATGVVYADTSPC